MPKCGYINTEEIHKQYFHLYLKEIEFRFNNRNSDLYPIISKILVKTVADL